VALLGGGIIFGGFLYWGGEGLSTRVGKGESLLGIRQPRGGGFRTPWLTQPGKAGLGPKVSYLAKTSQPSLFIGKMAGLRGGWLGWFAWLGSRVAVHLPQTVFMTDFTKQSRNPKE